MRNLKFEDKQSSVTVIGAGSWGTALALVLTDNGINVTLTDKIVAHLLDIKENKVNKSYLPGIKLPVDKINFEISAETAIQENEICVCALPTQYIRDYFSVLPAGSLKGKKIINVSKGIEIKTQKRVSEIFDDLAGKSFSENYCILTGPSHAEEVSRKQLTSIIAASKNAELAELTQKLFNNSYFRIYTGSDVSGAEIGGALKNIIAIAAGVCDGLKLGDNARAALITRGLAEITRFGIAFGADERTFSGLSGLGDLVVTCGSSHSRNYRCGLALAKNNDIEAIKISIGQVIEGVYTAEAVYDIALKAGIDMPISEQIYKLIKDKSLNAAEAVTQLMTRISKPEFYR